MWDTFTYYTHLHWYSGTQKTLTANRSTPHTPSLIEHLTNQCSAVKTYKSVASYHLLLGDLSVGRADPLSWTGRTAHHAYSDYTGKYETQILGPLLIMLTVFIQGNIKLKYWVSEIPSPCPLSEISEAFIIWGMSCIYPMLFNLFGQVKCKKSVIQWWF